MRSRSSERRRNSPVNSRSSFRNAHNLRELSLEDRCVTIERDGLAAISRLDFLTLKGVCVLGA